MCPMLQHSGANIIVKILTHRGSVMTLDAAGMKILSHEITLPPILPDASNIDVVYLCFSS